MTRHLRAGEFCSIHRSASCLPCHKEKKLKFSPSFSGGMRGGRKTDTPRRPPRFSQAVKQVPDPCHDRGYREECSQFELTRRKKLLIAQHKYNGTLQCVHCGDELKDFTEIQLCHKTPKGMGGSTHDDHWDNLALGHARCNFENGSKRVA